MAAVHEVFLKFLPHTADEAYVRQHFEGGGKSGLGEYKVSSLKDVRLAMDKVTGECRGTGWLTLGDEAEAQWLVEEWNVHPYNHMEGKHVEISHARPTGNWIQRTKTDIQCRYGNLCVRGDCTFKHPDGWDAEKNAKNGGKMGDANAMSRIVCRNGRHCNRPDCFFAHPDGRNCDPKPAKKSQKSIDDEEAARAIKGDFEQAERDAGAKSEKQQKKKAVVREEVFAEENGGLPDTFVPDADRSLKSKKKSKKVEAKQEGGKETAGKSMEPAAPSKKKKKKKKKQTGIDGPSGESCGDKSALTGRCEAGGAEKKRKKIVSQEEAKSSLPKTKKKKKREG